MKKLLVILLTFVSVSVSAQWATYKRIETPQPNIGNSSTNNSTPKIQQYQEEKEEIHRATGYYLDASRQTARVSLQFTIHQSQIGEVLTIVAYKKSSDLNWMSAKTIVGKTGYYDPEDFDYKVGILNLGTVYFNY